MTNLLYYYAGSFLLVALPFISYFGGVYIRKKVIPAPKSLTLKKQLILGIPFSLLIVPPLILPFYASSNLDPPVLKILAMLTLIGATMEQGMVLHETVTSRIDTLITDIRKNSATNK